MGLIEFRVIFVSSNRYLSLSGFFLNNFSNIRDGFNRSDNIATGIFQDGSVFYSVEK